MPLREQSRIRGSEPASTGEAAKEAPAPAKKKAAGEFASVLKERDTYLFGLFYGVTFGGFVGFASFLAILLGDQYGLTKVRAGELAALG